MWPCSLQGASRIRSCLRCMFGEIIHIEISSSAPSFGTLREGPAILPAPDETPYQMKVLDVDGDGRADLVAVFALPPGGTNSFRVRAMLNRGSGTFIAGSSFEGNASKPPFSLDAADLDGDGRPDLIFPLSFAPLTPGHRYETEVWYARNFGGGSFAPMPLLVNEDHMNLVGNVVAEDRGCRGPAGLFIEYSESELGVLHPR